MEARKIDPDIGLCALALCVYGIPKNALRGRYLEKQYILSENEDYWFPTPDASLAYITGRMPEIIGIIHEEAFHVDTNTYEGGQDEYTQLTLADWLEAFTGIEVE